MRRNRVFKTLALLLLLLAGVAVWVYWPAPPIEIPRPQNVSALDARLAEQIETGCELVRLAPDEAATWGELGMVYQANGMPDLAIACYQRAIQLDGQDPHWWYYTAMAHSELGNTPKTLEFLGQVIARKKDFAPAYWRRGLILLNHADLPGAEKEFRQAIKCDPRDPSGWRGLARVLLQQDRPDEAKVLLLRWLATGAYDRYAHQLLGRAYRQLGEPEKAALELQESGDIKPVWQDAWMFEVVQYGCNVGVLMKEARHGLEQHQFARVIAILKPLAEQIPDDISVLNTLAAAYVQVQDYESAIRLVRQSSNIQPNHFEAHLILATARYRQEMYSDAMKAINRALECNPACGDAYEIKGLLLDHDKKPDQAIAMFRKAEECEPNDPRYQYQIAMVHCRANQWEKAVDIFKPVVKKYPTFVPGLIGLALAHMELAQFDEAVVLLNQARQRDPRNPSLQYAARRMAEIKSARAGGTGNKG